MSGMFEPKQDKMDRKLARSKQEEKEKRKKRIIAISIIAALLLLSAVAITINSSFIRRSVPVVTIDGVNFTTAEFEYFFHSEFMEYSNFMSQFQGMGGMPDASRPLSSQIYDPETGETWADFFVGSTLDRLADIVALYNAAKAAGFELPAEDRAQIEEEIEMMEMQALFSGFPSVESLLQQMFGTSMNISTFRKVLEFVSIAGSYSEHMRDSFSYQESDLERYYAENRDDLDVFNYRQFQIDIHSETQDEVRSAALTIAEGITNEDEFLAAAAEYDAFYSDPDTTFRMMQGNRLDFDIVDWMLDETRSYGDTTVVDTELGSNIIFFISRDDNNYRTVGMRQILIVREYIDAEEFPAGEADPGFLQALEDAENEARERAEHVNSLFIAAGETEDALIALMEEYSDDNTEGGYYSNITKFPYQSPNLVAMKVVPEIEDWLFDENRTIGDSEMIYTSAFGYHLLYFTGFGDTFSTLIAEDRMRNRDHIEWLDALTIGTPVKRPAFILVHI